MREAGNNDLWRSMSISLTKSFNAKQEHADEFNVEWSETSTK